jgi:predicted RNA-binding protein with PIN domain
VPDQPEAAGPAAAPVPGSEPAPGQQAGAGPAREPEPGGTPGPLPLPDLPEPLLAGYLDTALAALRAASATDLPGALRQYQTWTPRRLKHPRVLGLVKRALGTDAAFRAAVDSRVLDEEEALARLLRAGRHVEALASGEAPEVVAKVGLALGAEGALAVQAAADALATSNAQAEAEAARSALAGAADELDAARARAEAEAAAGRAVREELRLVRRELRRSERQVEALTERCRELEAEVRRAEAAVQAARQQAADEQRRQNGRIAELQARLTEIQRQYRTLRRASVQVDPVVAEAVGALERDLATLRRAAGLPEPGRKPSGGPAVSQARPLERRTPLPVPGGRGADDPETLAAWMSVPEVLVLVDGYNVTKHERGFPEKSLEDQRTLLVDLCRRMSRRWGAHITVVFDGANVAPVPTRLPLGAVDVVFTDPGRTADDEIVARVNAAPPERPVVVVSSDNELRQRSAALGASVTRSTALLGLSSR